MSRTAIALLLVLGWTPAGLHASPPNGHGEEARQDWGRLEGSWRLSTEVEMAIADQVGENPYSSNFGEPYRLIRIRVDKQLGHSLTEQGILAEGYLASFKEKGHRILMTGAMGYDDDTPDIFVLTQSRGEVRLWHGTVFCGLARLFLIESMSKDKDMLMMQPLGRLDHSGEPVWVSAAVAPYFRQSE